MIDDILSACLILYVIQTFWSLLKSPPTLFNLQTHLSKMNSSFRKIIQIRYYICKKGALKKKCSPIKDSDQRLRIMQTKDSRLSQQARQDSERQHRHTGRSAILLDTCYMASAIEAVPGQCQTFNPLKVTVLICQWKMFSKVFQSST